MNNALSNLPCFIHIEQISSITLGLSQRCFKVNADNKVYFAKSIHNNTEVKVASNAAKQGVSPAVFYHDQHWLITHFIDASNLALSTMNTDDKIDHAIALMARCHQLTTKPTQLSPRIIMNNLINKIHFSAMQNKELSQLAESILVPLEHSNNLVCCHGDINFSNILIDQEKNTWLVDYECACSAPVEYDLAMFIAVNNLTEDKIIAIKEQYERQLYSIKVDIKRLQGYLVFSYFINSLWYINAYQQRGCVELLTMHKQQWQKFISANSKTYAHQA